MSALTPKADMCGALADVRFVPIADIGRTCGLTGDGTRRSGQHDPDFRELARLRIDLDHAAMLLDDDIVTEWKGRGRCLLRLALS